MRACSNRSSASVELPRLRFLGFTIEFVDMAAVALTPVVTIFSNGEIPEWPEPIHRVQVLAESGLDCVPPRYIKPESERPYVWQQEDEDLEIPIIDLSGLQDENRRHLTLAELGHACEEWGFFHIINHGIPLPIVQRLKMVAKQFFELPLEEKQAYANNPSTYEGYGSRLGVDKDVALDWCDYFYLNVLPTCIRDMSKWPSRPSLWRETAEEYSEHVAKLTEKLLAAISCTLNLPPTSLRDAFGVGDKMGVSLRVNFYPPCPQPELTLGLSAHSDPGGITILLQDDEVEGLQVRHDGMWVGVNIVPGALLVNLGDQLEIMSNGQYKSVEHRAVVNNRKERISVASFCNPDNELVVGPIKELIADSKPSQYQPMVFKEYRSFIRRNGVKGKKTLQPMLSPGVQASSHTCEPAMA
eukprot:c25204_g1_i1 orf=14-1252(-)